MGLSLEGPDTNSDVLVVPASDPVSIQLQLADQPQKSVLQMGPSCKSHRDVVTNEAAFLARTSAGTQGVCPAQQERASYCMCG